METLRPRSQAVGFPWNDFIINGEVMVYVEKLKDWSRGTITFRFESEQDGEKTIHLDVSFGDGRTSHRPRSIRLPRDINQIMLPAEFNSFHSKFTMARAVVPDHHQQSQYNMGNMGVMNNPWIMAQMYSTNMMYVNMAASAAMMQHPQMVMQPGVAATVASNMTGSTQGLGWTGQMVANPMAVSKSGQRKRLLPEGAVPPGTEHEPAKKPRRRNSESNAELVALTAELTKKGPPWSCQKCAKTFKLAYNLAAHLFKGCTAVNCHWCKTLLTGDRARIALPAPPAGASEANGLPGNVWLCSQCGSLAQAGHSSAPTMGPNGTFTCFKCKEVFDTLKGLSVHGRYCKGVEWKCAWCDCSERETKSKGPGPAGEKSLCTICAARYRSGHSGPARKDPIDGMFVCGCGWKSAQIRGLLGHERTCSGGTWRCDWCGTGENQAKGKSTGPSGPATLCSSCGSRYRHGHHEPPKRDPIDGKYICEACGWKSDSIRGVASHQRSCTGGKWTCGWCNVHESEARGKAPGPNGPRTLCSKCGSRFRSGYSKPLIDDETGRFICDQCSRSYDTFTALAGHKRFCDGGNWRCEWCNCEGSTSSSKCSGPKGPKTLCSACGARFRSGHNRPPPRDPKTGLFYCLNCEKRFETIGGLGSHRRFCNQLHSEAALDRQAAAIDDLLLGGGTVTLPDRPASSLPNAVTGDVLELFEGIRFLCRHVLKIEDFDWNEFESSFAADAADIAASCLIHQFSVAVVSFLFDQAGDRVKAAACEDSKPLKKPLKNRPVNALTWPGLLMLYLKLYALDLQREKSSLLADDVGVVSDLLARKEFVKMDLAERASILKMTVSLALAAPTVHDHLDSVQTRLSKLRAAKRNKFDEKRKIIQAEFDKKTAEAKAVRAAETKRLAEEKAAKEKIERQEKAQAAKAKAAELALIAARAQSEARAATAEGTADVPIALVPGDPLIAERPAAELSTFGMPGGVPEAKARVGPTPNSIAAKAAAAAAEASRAAAKAEHEIENPPPPEDSRKRSNKRRRDRRKNSLRAEQVPALVSPDPADGAAAVTAADALDSAASEADSNAPSVAPGTEAPVPKASSIDGTPATEATGAIVAAGSSGSHVSAAQREHIAFETKRQAEVQAKQDIDKLFAKEVESIGVRRREPFGLDRNYNSFWVLAGDFSRLLVQKIAPDTGEESWISIETAEELDALSDSLRTKGVRENRLFERIKRESKLFKAAMKEANEKRRLVAKPPRARAKVELTRLEERGIEVAQSALLKATKFLEAEQGAADERCKFCMEVLNPDDQHCPICHSTFSINDLSPDAFAAHVMRCTGGRPREIPAVLPHSVLTAKAALQDMDAAMPPGWFVDNWDSDARTSWTERVKLASTATELEELTLQFASKVHETKLGVDFKPWTELELYQKGEQWLLAPEQEPELVEMNPAPTAHVVVELATGTKRAVSVAETAEAGAGVAKVAVLSSVSSAVAVELSSGGGEGEGVVEGKGVEHVRPKELTDIGTKSEAKTASASDGDVAGCAPLVCRSNVDSERSTSLSGTTTDSADHVVKVDSANGAPAPDRVFTNLVSTPAHLDASTASPVPSTSVGSGDQKTPPVASYADPEGFPTATRRPGSGGLRPAGARPESVDRDLEPTPTSGAQSSESESLSMSELAPEPVPTATGSVSSMSSSLPADSVPPGTAMRMDTALDEPPESAVRTSTEVIETRKSMVIVKTEPGAERCDRGPVQEALDVSAAVTIDETGSADVGEAAEPSATVVTDDGSDADASDAAAGEAAAFAPPVIRPYSPDPIPWMYRPAHQWPTWKPARERTGSRLLLWIFSIDQVLRYNVQQPQTMMINKTTPKKMAVPKTVPKKRKKPAEELTAKPAPKPAKKRSRGSTSKAKRS